MRPRMMGRPVFSRGRNTGGGIRLPRNPTEEEMNHCEYAQRVNAICPGLRGERQWQAGSRGSHISCNSCPHHPNNIRYR
jgi:hypothetical protein